MNILARLVTRYGLAVPANPGLASTRECDSVTDACQTGMDAALYDELEPKVDNAGTHRVFGNLQAASLNNHMPSASSES